MALDNMIFTRYVNCFYARDPKRRKKEFIDRRFACFILTLSGKICFTADGKSYITDAEHAVFLPQGLCYTNECYADAESIVINFTTAEKYTAPVSLRAVSPQIAKSCYQSLKKLSASLAPQKNMLLQKELYGIAAELLSVKEKETAADKLVTAAMEYMMEHSSDPSLSVQRIAEHCFISEIYLHKLFAKKYGSTPIRMLRDIRMQKAYLLAKETRPVQEIADAVGYSAVYQFSRAYKKYFGVSPSET